jgi:hypothetical protein
MRRPQFSLKTMLWLMVVAGAFCAGVAWERRSEEARRDAIRATIVTDSDFWSEDSASQDLTSGGRP